MRTTLDPLVDEDGIVWLEDIARLDYVRESIADAPTRRGSVRWDVGRRVGYAVLAATAEADSPRRFLRRVFWLKEYDRDSDPTGSYRRGNGAPAEAVDPRTVTPRVPGDITERAWGSSLFDEQVQLPTRKGAA